MTITDRNKALIQHLQHRDKPGDRELDHEIAVSITYKGPGFSLPAFSTDYNVALKQLKEMEIDWIMADVNGHMGGTPYAAAGVTDDKASYSFDPLLSLWLSVLRLLHGDER